MFKLLKTLICLILIGQHTNSIGQPHSNNLPYDRIFAYGMDADVAPVFPLLEQPDLTPEEQQFKDDFEARFKGATDNSKRHKIDHLGIGELITIFEDYWRKSLLNPSGSYEGALGARVIPFLMNNYPPIRGKKVSRDSLGFYISQYVHHQGYFTVEKVDFQGRLIDLMIWKKQEVKTWEVNLGDETPEIDVYLLGDFVTLGWMGYATLDHHHPGGWTNELGLFCLEDAYDLESENFKISFLAHEARHFLDKQVWPDMESADLEYRAKLTELSLASETVLRLITFFIDNANQESRNGHQVANYRLVSDLSRELFQTEFEEDLELWNKASTKKINKTAQRLLEVNAESLADPLTFDP